MYKLLSTLFISLYFALSLPAVNGDEKYFVLYVEGAILNLTQNKNLKAGDYLRSNDQLRFKDKKSRALVMSGSKGRFMLRPDGQNTAREGELVSLVNKILLPIKKNRELSTRRVGMLVSNLDFYFGNSQFFILGESLNFRLNTTNYPLDTDSFLAVSYTYQGETISKRIPFRGNTVYFKKDAIFRSKDGIPINPVEIDSVQLYHINTPDKFLITTFKLNFVQESDLEEITKNFIEIEKDKMPADKTKKHEYLMEFYFSIFGMTDRNILFEWLEKKGF